MTLISQESNKSSRRKFIAQTSAFGALLMTQPFRVWSQFDQDSRVQAIISKSLGIDTHNHVDVPFDKSIFANQKYGLGDELRNSGFLAICMTFCVDRPDLKEEGEAYERFMTSLDEMDEILEQNSMKRALSYADLAKARKKGQPIVVQSVEGGHFLEGKIERLEAAYKRGLRHLGLLHDNQSAYPIGDIYTNPEKFGGLTDFGKEVVKSSNELGLLVDLTHCSDKAITDAMEISNKPLVISHTGLNTQLGTNEKFAKMMMPRLISKEMAKTFASSGGVVGVWTHLAETPAEYVANISAMVDVVGVDHVCIGTDTKMAVPENANSRFGKKTNDVWSDSKGFLYTVVESMINAGFADEEISKIIGGNYCRILKEAVG